MNSRNVTIATIVFLVLVIIGMATLNYTTVDTTEITVVSKERTTTGTGDNRRSFWIVFGEEEVFSNRDSIFFLKFNSSDVQRQLEVGKTCQVKINLFRIPIISLYRNILEVGECRTS